MNSIGIISLLGSSKTAVYNLLFASHIPCTELIMKTSSFTESKKFNIKGSKGGSALIKITSKPAKGSISSRVVVFL